MQNHVGRRKIVPIQRPSALRGHLKESRTKQKISRYIIFIIFTGLIGTCIGAMIVTNCTQTVYFYELLQPKINRPFLFLTGESGSLTNLFWVSRYFGV